MRRSNQQLSTFFFLYGVTAAMAETLVCLNSLVSSMGPLRFDIGLYSTFKHRLLSFLFETFFFFFYGRADVLSLVHIRKCEPFIMEFEPVSQFLWLLTLFPWVGSKLVRIDPFSH
jgi:hypothetical protein